MSRPSSRERLIQQCSSQNGRDSSLFGLAPCGVCRARGITAAAVRSYRTFSPLPRPSFWTVIGAAVILSKRFLRSEGSGRAARCVVLFETQKTRVWLASKTTLSNAHNDGRGGMFSVALSVAKCPTLNFANSVKFRMSHPLPDVIRHTALRSSDFPPRPFPPPVFAQTLIRMELTKLAGRMGRAAVRSGCLHINYSETTSDLRLLTLSFGLRPEIITWALENSSPYLSPDGKKTVFTVKLIPAGTPT